MGRRPEKEKRKCSNKRSIINWHVSMDEKRVILNFSKDNGTNMNEYVKRAVLDQKVVVRGSDYNRSRIISRVKELDQLLDELNSCELLSTDEITELHVINDIRRKWYVEKETA